MLENLDHKIYNTIIPIAFDWLKRQSYGLPISIYDSINQQVRKLTGRWPEEMIEKGDRKNK